MVMAAPEPTTTTCTLNPDCCLNRGIKRSSNPESWVLEVVARIRSTIAGVVGVEGIGVG
jgi:hypothetical protein